MQIGLGTTALIISNEEMENIMKIVKSLDKSGLLIKVVGETIKNKAKQQKVDLLASRILGNMLAGKPKIPGRGVIEQE